MSFLRNVQSKVKCGIIRMRRIIRHCNIFVMNNIKKNVANIAYHPGNDNSNILTG